MAIPFNLPSDEYTLEQYRRLHQLILDLMDLLRVFVGNVSVPVIPDQNQNEISNNHSVTVQGQSSSSGTSQLQLLQSSLSVNNLPDVVTSTLQNINDNSHSGGGHGSSMMMEIGDIESENNTGHFHEDESAPIVALRRKSSLTRRSSVIRARGKLLKRKKEKCTESQCHTKNCMCFYRESHHHHCRVEITKNRSYEFQSIGNNKNVDEKNKTSMDAPICDLVAGVIQNDHAMDVDEKLQCSHHENIRKLSSQAYNRLKKIESPLAGKKGVVPWIQIGEDIHRITEALKNTFDKEDEKMKSADEKESIFSSMMPVGRTMIATALIYIGWKILKQS